jgi:hypothetical protein
VKTESRNPKHVSVRREKSRLAKARVTLNGTTRVQRVSTNRDFITLFFSRLKATPFWSANRSFRLVGDGQKMIRRRRMIDARPLQGM